MPSQAEIEEFQTDLDVLTALAIAEAASAVAATEDDDAEEAADILTVAYPELLEPFLSAAGELAANWYRQLTPHQIPDREPGAPELIVGATTRQALAAAAEFEPTLAAAPPSEQLESTVRWAVFAPTGLDPANSVLSRLSGATQRYVSNSARDTLELNAGREGIRWARHASANACAFCRMLATRGAVYTSEQAAGNVVGRGREMSLSDRRRRAAGITRREGGRFLAGGIRTRGTQQLGEKYHDNCHCLPVPIRAGDSYQPPPYVTEWDEQYIQATRETPGRGRNSAIDTTAVLAHMRANPAAASDR
ncbi:hypothetical protein [Nocardia sp. CA-290969]|uniref:VG15 protein n=1 Tax=Nocardia sp. CA-290969 TaxID=3239986 RepID=UPI003D93E181